MPYCGRCLNVGRGAIGFCRLTLCDVLPVATPDYFRRRFEHELLIHNGSIDRHPGYVKLDEIFLLWSPDLYVRWEKHSIELPDCGLSGLDLGRFGVDSLD